MLENARMVLEQELENLRKSSVENAQNTQSCSKGKNNARNTKGIPKVAEHPWEEHFFGEISD